MNMNMNWSASEDELELEHNHAEQTGGHIVAMRRAQRLGTWER
jgi:hypothetical protein